MFLLFSKAEIIGKQVDPTPITKLRINCKRLFKGTFFKTLPERPGSSSLPPYKQKMTGLIFRDNTKICFFLMVTSFIV